MIVVLLRTPALLTGKIAVRGDRHPAYLCTLYIFIHYCHFLMNNVFYSALSHGRYMPELLICMAAPFLPVLRSGILRYLIQPPGRKRRGKNPVTGTINSAG
jgi:hypothetical protein